jgi:O-6-methylguanine DNA methyltransferase
MELFKDNVIAVVKTIKKGSVLTYAQVAKNAGNPKASRAVGTIMANNKDKNIPCHRVVKSDGSIGMYNGLQGMSKEKILKQEGVRFYANGKVIL